MKIFFHPYFLQPIQSLNAVSAATARQGFLIKIEDPNGAVGYADLHPWVELGDSPLSSQIEDMRLGKISSQLCQTLCLAQKDAHARLKKQSLFHDLPSIKNNFLISNIAVVDSSSLKQIQDQGFDILKIKVGRDFKKEMARLNDIARAGFKMRLDFNASVSWFEFQMFFAGLDDATLENIQYVEDPCVYDVKIWGEAQKIVKIAMDNQFSKYAMSRVSENSQGPAFDVLILKPAKMKIEDSINLCRKFNLQTTVTSYMDHPVGVLHSLAVAMQVKKSLGDQALEAGCYTHHLYQENQFSEEINIQNANIIPPQGFGIGFDKILEALPWQLICKQVKI